MSCRHCRARRSRRRGQRPRRRRAGRQGERSHAALVAGFRSLGIAADERPDGFVVGGSRGPSTDGAADARGDHRMAMAFAIAALAGRSPSTIVGADSVAISYPGFFDTLDRLVA